MSKHLLRAFAKDDPERFARLLGASQSTEETVVILTVIPDGLECDVVARLAPKAADRLLNGLADEVAIDWLNSASINDGRKLLSRVGKNRADRLIAGMSNKAKRRKLRRLAGYPPGSIGDLLHVEMVSVNRTTPAAEIEEEIQHHGEDLGGPVTILNDHGAVLGVLDLAKFIRNTDPEATAEEFCIELEPVYTHASAESQLGRKDWAYLTSLPVADFEGKPLGYVTHFELKNSIGATEPGGLFLQSGVELSKRFLEFFIYVMTLVLDRRVER